MILYGAGGRTWTGTKLPSRDFKSLASAYSATSAYIGGTTRNRTVDEGFADPSLTAWLWCHNSFPLCWIPFLKKMERKTRFELATFTLARWRSTTEPLPHFLHILYSNCLKKFNGGSYRTRTYDPLLVRQKLYQLS